MVLISEQLRVSPMRDEDIAEVRTIELAVFPTPWPGSAYQRELNQNRAAHYICLRRNRLVVGYGGLWAVGEEAHVTTIGVAAEWQGQGFGRAIFAALVNRSYALRANFISLEVRPNNEPAIRLYENFGFKVIGRRRGYYTDNGEDALVMWSDLIHAPHFKRRFLAILEGLEIEGLGAPPSADIPSS
ncbi:MAG TPA: ribosomal protein S18-alanine N-acetyltransferase [Candidatus Dormibacteraeota bacterium]|nr:ribosomal protein S18-alanine N-acetyltransferase [Candidatus Dormibacteraeota bacterium]